MASIRINGLPQKQTIPNTVYRYADLHLDIQNGYVTGNRMFQQKESNDIKIDYDAEAIRNSLYNLFTTTPGQKLLNPAYGLDLKQYLFYPVSVETAIEIKRQIFTQVSVYEPRVKVENVSITILEDVNEFDIDITYSIPSLNITNFKIFGSLNQGGFIPTR